jgi:hypothetical protein
VGFGRLLPLHKPSLFGDKVMIQKLMVHSDGLTGKITTPASRHYRRDPLSILKPAKTQHVRTGAHSVKLLIGEADTAAVQKSLGLGLGVINGSVGQQEQTTRQNAALLEQSAAAADSLK